MMTTGKTFGTSSIQNPNGIFPDKQQVINEVAPPISSATPVEAIQTGNSSNDKNRILNEWIEKFTKGEITEEQLNIIKKTLK